MRIRIAAFLLLCAVGANAQSAKKKKDSKAPEPSPLDKYISDAYRDYKAPEAAPPPGSLWSPNAIFSNLGMDLRASRVDDLVTIVVNENFSAVANGDVNTQRQSTAQSNITQLAGIKSKTGALANLLNSNTQTQLQGKGETSRNATLTATW
jgi:flagellar L-ring protein FlgH